MNRPATTCIFDPQTKWMMGWAWTSFSIENYNYVLIDRREQKKNPYVVQSTDFKVVTNRHTLITRVKGCLHTTTWVVVVVLWFKANFNNYGFCHFFIYTHGTLISPSRATPCLIIVGQVRVVVVEILTNYILSLGNRTNKGKLQPSMTRMTPEKIQETPKFGTSWGKP